MSTATAFTPLSVPPAPVLSTAGQPAASASALIAPAPTVPAPVTPVPTAPATTAPVPSAAPGTETAPAPTAPTEPVPATPVPTGPGSDLDPLGDEIALLSAHITAATYRLLCLLRVYDEEERWRGFRSCAHWLSWRTGVSLGPAREKVRVARALPSLSLIPEAFAKGEISYSKVRALTRIADAENEAELLDFARHGTTAQVERLIREWRRIDRGGASRAARAERRGLSVWLADDGGYEVRGRLEPEVGALLLKALEAAEARLYRAEREAGTEHRTSAEQRRADALGLWLEERARPKVQLVVHSFEGEERQGEERQREGWEPEERQPPESPVPLVTEDGSRVSAETSSRLACDAEVVPIARAADGSVLDVGRRRRTVGWRLRKALEARDGGCRFPGCGSRARTHAHHVTPWAEGGETAMNNLMLLCPFHHRAVHEGGWRVEMDEWGAPRFLNPLGVQVPVVPVAPDIGAMVPRHAPPALATSSPALAKLSPALAGIPSAPSTDPSPRPARDFGLARWHGRNGIDAWTGAPVGSPGQRIDWGWALACLWREGG